MEETRVLVTDGFYKHFKDKLYQVRGIAYHSETKEKMVVYQAMYGDFQLYVRPYDMFMSEVDHAKYPDIKQKYRFERVRMSETPPLGGSQDESTLSEAVNADNEKLSTSASLTAEAYLADFEDKPKDEDRSCNEYIDEDADGTVDPRLLQFLDAETFQEKLNVITGLRNKLDDRLINDIATAMDITVEEGPLSKRYDSLRSCLLAHVKYECTR